MVRGFTESNQSPNDDQSSYWYKGGGFYGNLVLDSGDVAGERERVGVAAGREVPAIRVTIPFESVLKMLWKPVT